MRNKITYCSIIVFVLLCCVTKHQINGGSNDDTLKGKQYYETNCISCHTDILKCRDFVSDNMKGDFFLLLRDTNHSVFSEFKVSDKERLYLYLKDKIID